MVRKLFYFLYAVIVLLPLALMLYWFPFIEDPIPMHFDGSGTVDGTGSKYSLLVFPVLALVILIGLQVFSRLQLKEQKLILSLHLIGFGIAQLFGSVGLMLLYIAYKHATHVSDTYFFMVFTFSFSVLFIFMGASMLTCGRNKWIGFRTKWTLASDEVWNKTHALIGRLYISFGIGGMLASFLVNRVTTFLIIIAVSIVIGLIGTLYSYSLSKNT